MSATHTRQLRVQDIMTRDPICVSAADTVADLARLFDSNEISGAPVVDGLSRLIGVVSKTDIIHRALEGPIGSQTGSGSFEIMAEGMTNADLDPESLGVVEDFMTTEPITARPDELLPTVARRMAAERVHRLIVVDDESHPIGIVTALDLLKAFPK